MSLGYLTVCNTIPLVSDNSADFLGIERKLLPIENYTEAVYNIAFPFAMANCLRKKYSYACSWFVRVGSSEWNVAAGQKNRYANNARLFSMLEPRKEGRTPLTVTAFSSLFLSVLCSFIFSCFNKKYFCHVSCFVSAMATKQGNQND